MYRRKGILRRKELEHELKLSRSTIYALMQKGMFPRPIRLSPGAVGWTVESIDQWLEDRKNGDTLFRPYNQEER